ncbi:MAG: hypothetical protein ACREUZ_15320 [Burkholderiales bacterium]
MLVARAFGSEIADLDLNFARGLRPQLVTRLLVGCVRDGRGEAWGEEQVWHWPVTRRTQALLAVSAATSGTSLNLLSRCGNAECGEVMEMNLDLELFRRECGETVFEFRPAPDVHFLLRLPSGDDQRSVGSTAEADPLALLRRLVVEGNAEQFPTEWLRAAEAALEEHDEFTAMVLRVACPWCGHENRIDFDLEGYVLRNLQRTQESLLDRVHRLARAYHWSEAEIFHLPEHRREYYLQRIDEETD